MAKVSGRSIQVRAKDGAKFNCRLDAFVDGEGTFSIRVPAELRAEVTARPPTRDDSLSRNEMGLKFGRQPNHDLFVECALMDDGVRFLKAAAVSFLTVEEIHERVICYNREARVKFAKQPDGRITHNAVGGGKWFGACDDHTNIFSLGFAAQVFEKTTFRRPSGDTTTYKRTDPEEVPEAAPLNRFVKLDVRSVRDRSGGSSDSEPDGEIPFTPEAARVLGEMMFGLCRLAEKVDAFFSSPETLSARIAAQSVLGIGLDNDKPAKRIA